MRKDSLPSPGMLSMGINLQSTMSKAISAVELAAMTGAGGKTSLAKQLDVFLTAAKTAIAGFIDAVAPTVLTRALTDASTIRIRADKWLDAQYVPVTTAFAITGTVRTVTAVRVDGPDIVLTVSAPFATGNAINVAYTQPGAVSNARDLSGNLLATFAAAAVTNPL
jgi:hypothetical protein